MVEFDPAPIEIMTEKKHFFEILSGDDLWNERISKLEDYGKVNSLNGDFEFIKCDICKSPWIAHEKTDNPEVCNRKKRKGDNFSSQEIKEVEDWIKAMPMFKLKLAQIDRRQRACYCDECGKTLTSRAAYESHLVTDHRIMNANEMKEENQSKDTTLVSILSTMEKLLSSQSHNSEKPAQLVKSKLPPQWIGQAYEVFEKEIEEWNDASKEEEYEKYSKLMESLKKNTEIKGLKEYIIESLIPTMNGKDRKEMTVLLLLENLRARYGKTKMEKLKEVLKKITEFDVKADETCEDFSERFYRLINAVDKEEVHKHLKFVLSILMIGKAHEGGLVTGDEKARLLNVIQKGEDAQNRVPLEEEKVVGKLKNEFYKLKSENSFTRKEASNSYYTSGGRSRYENWKSFKNSDDFKKFKKSESRPGYWRSSSRYVREPSRSGSRVVFERKGLQRGFKDRSRSKSVNSSWRNEGVKEELEKMKKGYCNLEKKTDEIMKMLEKIGKNSNNVGLVDTAEDEEINVVPDVLNVVYAKDIKECEMMIVDTGCPKSLCSGEWLDEYLKENNQRL